MENKFKVGDIVKVTNWGSQYSTCTSWFTEHASELELEWMINYRYGNVSWDDNHSAKERFKVLYVDQNEGKCLIGALYTNKVKSTYLIGEGGLVHARKRMTQDDIETELGYRVELIGEWEND